MLLCHSAPSWYLSTSWDGPSAGRRVQIESTLKLSLETSTNGWQETPTVKYHVLHWQKKTVSPIPMLFLLTSNHTSKLHFFIVPWFQTPQGLEFPRRRILTLKMSSRSFVALHLCLIAWFVSFNVLFWFGNVAWWRIPLRKNGLLTLAFGALKRLRC